MREGLYAILTIVVARILWLKVGRAVRFIYRNVFGSKEHEKRSDIDHWGLDKHLDVEGFKDRIVGYLFIMLCVIIVLMIVK